MELRGLNCVLATIAVGACISLFALYHFHARSKGKGSGKRSDIDKKKLSIDITLDQGHFSWLQKCTEEYSLPSIDKTLRILLTYTQHFAKEMSVFEEIRCKFCNDKQKVAHQFVIDAAHNCYLEEMVFKHKLANKDKAVRIIVEYAMTLEDQATIFQVKRCSHGDTCKYC